MNHTGADGDSAIQAGESGDFLDLARHFDNGIGAIRKSTPAWTARPSHRDGVIADAFAGGFELAFESRPGSSTSTATLGAGGFFGERTRRLAADFFIGIHLHHYFAGDWDVRFPQGAHRENEKSDAGFHVEHAGSPEPAFELAEGHGAQGAEGPHGIGMTERQNLPGFFRAGQ